MVIVLSLAVAVVQAAGVRYEQTDLSGRVVSTAGREPAVLQFNLVPADAGQFLSVNCEVPFAVFREGVVLASSVKSLRWKVDSISNIYGMPMTLTIVRQQQGKWSVMLEKQVPEDPLDPGLRIRSRYAEFATLVGALVVFYLLVIMFSSMRNLRDYLSVDRAFLTASREDKPAETRITARPAVMMYGFFILTVSYTLTLYTSGPVNQAGFAELMLLWLKWIAVTAIFLTVRLILISFLAYLYRVQDGVEMQVTGMVRSGLLASVLLCALLVPALMISPSGAFRGALLVWVWMILQLIYTGTLFARLSRLTHAKPFHLFFYLCTSELIPLVYLVTTF